MLKLLKPEAYIYIVNITVYIWTADWFMVIAEGRYKKDHIILNKL